MPSIIQGYEYDIFISYRQKDNKYDGWVTEFVNHLKDEIEATFKEDISIYFDENPHDGLLETHDVDQSLNDKVKCLVFIPIVSQTYCDPKCFAWQNEFLAFNKLAKNDEYGLKVTLPNGNTASRVLPIRIHDIDGADKKLVEDEIGFLRSIDFVYKEPGVNRPLSPDDSEEKNLESTKYRNQINKVANAIQEIISGLKNVGTEINEKEVSSTATTTTTPSIETKPKGKSKVLMASIGLLMILALVYFFYNKNDSGAIDEEIDKSIAVLPFTDMSQGGDQQYFADGVTEDILTQLQRMGELRVISRTSMEQYRNTTKDAPEIGAELKVSYLLEGSVRKADNQIMITAQLIKTESDSHIWADNFTSEYTTKGLFDIQRQIAENIVGELKLRILPAKVKEITKTLTDNKEAYDLYLRGKFYTTNYLNTHNERDFRNAIQLLQQAINIDPEFALPYVMMGFAHFWKPGIANTPDSIKLLIDKALTINPNLPEGFSLRGWYFFEKGHFEKAEEDLKHSLTLNPNSDWNLKLLGMLYFLQGRFKNTFELWKRQTRLNPNLGPIDYADLGDFYLSIGDYSKSKIYFEKALQLQPDHAFSLRGLQWLAVIQERFQEALDFSNELLGLYPDNSIYYFDKASILALNHEFNDALEIINEGTKINEGGHSILQIDDRERMYGYILWNNNRKDEAMIHFEKYIKYCKNEIRLGSLFGKSHVYYDLASIYAFLGQKEETYKMLKEYSKVSFNFGLEKFITIDPLFESLWKDDEFLELIDKDLESKIQIREDIKHLEAEVDF